MAIHFFAEETELPNIPKAQTKAWIKEIAKQHHKNTGELNFVFCSDEYLKVVNIEYLSHDYYTDIITFDQSESPKKIEGDIYISIDRVAENATEMKTNFETELNRVIIHGVLHLIGFKDKTIEEKSRMRAEEDASLEWWNVPRGT